MSDEELREVDHGRRALVKKLLAGAVAAPLIVSFGLDGVASAAKTAGFMGNMPFPNQITVNKKKLKKGIKKFAHDAQHFGNLTL
jgi:uncharacterized protein YybS (DUF2232 family)